MTTRLVPVVLFDVPEPPPIDVGEVRPLVLSTDPIGFFGTLDTSVIGGTALSDDSPVSRAAAVTEWAAEDNRPAPILPAGSTDPGSNELAGAELAIRDAVAASGGGEGVASTVLMRSSGLPERTFYRALRGLQDRTILSNVGTDTRPRWVLAHYQDPS